MLSVRFPRRCDLGLPPPSPLPPPQYTCMLHAHARTHAPQPPPPPAVSISTHTQLLSERLPWGSGWALPLCSRQRRSSFIHKARFMPPTPPYLACACTYLSRAYAHRAAGVSFYVWIV